MAPRQIPQVAMVFEREYTQIRLRQLEEHLRDERQGRLAAEQGRDVERQGRLAAEQEVR